MERVLDVAFEQEAHADRVPPRQLEPVVVKYREGDVSPREIRISRAVADRVFREQVAILMSDVEILDGRKARSAMCVPLWRGTDITGLVYVDAMTPMNDKDLELLTILSNYIGVGLERIRLKATIDSERSLRSRLERYHSPGVVSRILAEGASGSEVECSAEMEVSVLFADIVGFTPRCARLRPGEVLDLLNGYFSVLADVVFKYDGTLDKFIGDAVMAVFGAPLPQPDHAERAVRVALEMHQALGTVNERRGETDGLQLRIGINSGPAVVGNIGSASRVDFTVLGDTVNVASRLESSVARPGRIAIGAGTYDLVKGLCRVVELGPRQLKGVELPVLVYEVVGVEG